MFICALSLGCLIAFMVFSSLCMNNAAGTLCRNSSQECCSLSYRVGDHKERFHCTACVPQVFANCCFRSYAVGTYALLFWFLKTYYHAGTNTLSSVRSSLFLVSKVPYVSLLLLSQFLAMGMVWYTRV